MEKFITDLPHGKKEGRYFSYNLPQLPFNNQDFDLPLCSHFLFLYSKQFTADFHRDMIRELLRVAKEVRIFALLTLERKTSQHLKVVCEDLSASDINYEIKEVNYEYINEAETRC